MSHLMDDSHYRDHKSMFMATHERKGDARKGMDKEHLWYPHKREGWCQDRSR